MPEKHQKHMSWTPGRFLNWAKDIGPYTSQITEYLLNSKSHPEQSYRACLGLLNLAKRYGKDRLESACLYGWNSGARSRKSIASILDKGMDKQQVENIQEFNPGLHENLRGPNYYH
jgi:transposase